MDDEQGAIQTCFHYNLKSTEGNLFFLNFILLLEAHHEFAIDPKENIQPKGKKKVRAVLLVLTIYRLNKPIGFVKDRSLGSIARPKFPLKILIFVDRSRSVKSIRALLGVLLLRLFLLLKLNSMKY